MVAVEAAVSAGVAVGDGGAEQLAVAVEQAEVDAPGVDADARHFIAELAGGESQAGEDVVPQFERPPVEAAVDVNRAVGKAVDFCQFERLAVEEAGEDTAAGGAEVDGEVDFAFHGGAGTSQRRGGPAL